MDVPADCDDISATCHVSTPDELLAAVADTACGRVVVEASGSPYVLPRQLFIERRVVVEAEEGASAPIVLHCAVAMSAGSLTGLTLRPPRGGGVGAGCPATVDILGGGDGGGAAAAALAAGADGDVEASPPVWAALTECDVFGPSAPPRGGSARAASRGGRAAAAALRVCGGAAPHVRGCRLVGARGPAVTAEAGTAPVLVSNTIVAGTEGAAVELRGTAEGTELRGNAVRKGELSTELAAAGPSAPSPSAGGGGGVLLSEGARALLCENKVRAVCGSGLEVASGASAVARANEIEESGGVGILVRGGGGGEFRANTVVGAWSRALELCGARTSAHVEGNTLRGSRSGVGVLVHGGAGGRIVENEILAHPLAGIEVGEGSAPVVERNRVRGCGHAGVLIGAGGGGTFTANEVRGNGQVGIECCSAAEGLRLESNRVSDHDKGAGVLVRGGGAGEWVANEVRANAIGVDLIEGAAPRMLRNTIAGNLRVGLRVSADVSARIEGNQIVENGRGRLVSHSRRGERTHGDDAGCGVLLERGATPRLEGNHIASNSGAGVFAHSESGGVLAANVFRDNRGAALAARPQSRTEARPTNRFADDRRAVTPSVVRRQRVPFDWTVGHNVAAEDKTLQEKAEEYRAQYRSMAGNLEAGAVSMLPEGADASLLCAIS